MIAGLRWLIGCCVPSVSWLFHSVYKVISTCAGASMSLTGTHMLHARVVRLFTVRTATGRGEVERILTAGHHTPAMTRRFTKYALTCGWCGTPSQRLCADACTARRYLRQSKRLGDVRNMLFRSRARFSVEQVTTMIIARKGIKPQSAHFRTRCAPRGASAAYTPVSMTPCYCIRSQTATKHGGLLDGAERHERGARRSRATAHHAVRGCSRAAAERTVDAADR